jgi:flagellar hook-associated protein 2
MFIDRLRFSGLSGIDTESMVDKLMKAERKPLDNLKKNKQLLEWKRDDYREVNKLLLEFRDMARDMRYSTVFTLKAVSSSNETVAKVTAGNNAMSGSYTLKVNELASGASLTSTVIPSDLIDGTPRSFTINGETISITGTETIQQFVAQINSKSGATGVKVSYDEGQNRLFFITNSSGADKKIEIDGSDLFWVKEKIFGQDPLDIDSNPILVTGKNAKIELNGTTLEFNSNTFSVNGLTISLRSKQSPSDPVINLTVSNDVDGIYENIKKFIDKYNEVIGKINDKISEKRNRNLVWPTDEEKEKMKEEDLKLWEQNAKKGMLERDPLIQKYLTQFREDFSTVLNGATPELDSIYDIGIETGNYKEKGKLKIDESKLKSAIANNPEKVMSLFTSYVEMDDPNNPGKKIMDYGKSGIAQRLYQNADMAIKEIAEKAGSEYSFEDESILTTEIKDISKKITDFEKKLIDIENRYIKKFSQMEQALTKANAQSSWLYQQGS